MKNINYIATLILSAIVFSCDSAEDEVTPDPGSNNEPVSVLVDGSGYTQVFDDVRTLSSASVLESSIGVLDFTVESNNKLHLAYFTSQPSQQDNLVNNERVSVDLDSKKEIALPSAADTLDYSPSSFGQKKKTLVIQQYRPYTNFFTYATIQNNSGSTTIEYFGDVTGTVGPTFNPTGSPDFGYRFPSTSISVGTADNAFSFMMPGLKTPTYILSGTSAQRFDFFNNSGKPILKSFSESDIFTYGSFSTILVRPDSAIAYLLDDQLTSRTKKSAIALTGLSAGTTLETLRHYTPDGKILGMLVKDPAQKKYWTFSYNFDTQILTAGLNGVTLDYAGAESDFDIDEFGNIYYTGYAANGSNTTGVSIYKKSLNGNVSVVGKDNFLKYGTVVALKILNGKIFTAVTGKQTNTMNYQLSILKQD